MLDIPWEKGFTALVSAIFGAGVIWGSTRSKVDSTAKKIDETDHRLQDVEQTVKEHALKIDHAHAMCLECQKNCGIRFAEFKHAVERRLQVGDEKLDRLLAAVSRLEGPQPPKRFPGLGD